MKTLLKAAVAVLLTGTYLAGVHFSTRSAGAAQTAATASREGLEFFEKKIRPALEANCYMCHSSQGKKPQGGLALDTREGMLQGGASGQPAIVPGDPEKSLLLRAIHYTDAKLQMPPGEQLPNELIKDFEAWVKMGAPDPRAAKAQPSTAAQAYDFAEARKFWSLRPLHEPSLPAVKNPAWVRSPIDRFVLAKLEEKNLKPVADAARRTLIRRATFDLIGLPPTPEEVKSFLDDTSEQAFEKVVDRLLASSHYGERWGRHWLDVVRYADTAGCNSDFPVPAAYKYRNYVIKSFNEDKPYDEFIREQIAGDLLPSRTEAQKHERIIATGYLAMSRRFGSRNKEFNLTIDDTIDNVGKAFLGLSVSCARCHDHKFDPIPQKDYYALYGIFNSTRYSFPGNEIYPHPAEMVALASGEKAEKFYKWQKELEWLDDRKEFLSVERGAAARNKAAKEKLAQQTSPQHADNRTGADEKKDDEPAFLKTNPRPADFDRDAMNSSTASKSTRMPEEVAEELNEVKSRIEDLDDRGFKIEKAYAVVEGLSANARVHRKGEPKNLGDEVPRGFLTVLGGQSLPEGYKGSGREHLANWIADAQNPLTARVMVNRIWQYHFGKGLVATPNDFGKRGMAPTHPELLDYLAAQFIKNKWSVKAMHRQIMLSHAYQLSSADDARQSEQDASSDWLWRFNRRRLSAEEIRDAMLAVSGALDPTPGEAHPFPPEDQWHYTQHRQFFAVYDTARRSVYLMQQRQRKHPLMEVFDGADTNVSTAPRPLSTTPLQALYFMNNPFAHSQADQLAVRVGMAFDQLPQRLDYAFRLVYGRPAAPHEISEATMYLRQARQDLRSTAVPADQINRQALASYLHVVLSSNEFLYVD